MVFGFCTLFNLTHAVRRRFMSSDHALKSGGEGQSDEGQYAPCCDPKKGGEREKCVWHAFFPILIQPASQPEAAAAS